MSDKITIHGGCHCGAVKFSAKVERKNKVLVCNCSICKTSGYEHLIVAKTDFNLVNGVEQLRSYKFGTGQANHLFCKNCGVKSFYQPRSHPDSYSIHLKCLDDVSGLEITRESFDGQNWENSRTALNEK
ncbi:MAG: GFA family protein [Gammaproteobacteria bacterium]|nr:GFA family protein [Gammaproteobacteria bacterium]